MIYEILAILGIAAYLTVAWRSYARFLEEIVAAQQLGKLRAEYPAEISALVAAFLWPLFMVARVTRAARHRR